MKIQLLNDFNKICDKVVYQLEKDEWGVTY